MDRHQNIQFIIENIFPEMGAKDLKSLNRILQKYGGRIDINVQLINDNELLLTEEFVFLS